MGAPQHQGSVRYCDVTSTYFWPQVLHFAPSWAPCSARWELKRKGADEYHKVMLSTLGWKVKNSSQYGGVPPARHLSLPSTCHQAFGVARVCPSDVESVGIRLVWMSMSLVTQSCPTLCDPMDCSPPGSSVHGDSPRQEYWSGLPYPTPGYLPNPGIEPKSPASQVDSLPSGPPVKPKNTGMGSLSLLQGIYPTQKSRQGLLHCRWILIYQGSPWMSCLPQNSHLGILIPRVTVRGGGAFGILG